MSAAFNWQIAIDVLNARRLEQVRREDEDANYQQDDYPEQGIQQCSSHGHGV